MKKILVIYYSQTGQLKDVVDSILAPIEKNPEVSVVYE
jgi:flavodoxin